MSLFNHEFKVQMFSSELAWELFLAQKFEVRLIFYLKRLFQKRGESAVVVQARAKYVRYPKLVTLQSHYQELIKPVTQRIILSSILLNQVTENSMKIPRFWLPHVSCTTTWTCLMFDYSTVFKNQIEALT